jgi:serine/threonine protein kinase
MTSSSDLSAGVEPGQVLAGKYRIERVLGLGGMGVVVAAHHIQLDERVALKFLLPAALQSPESVARFAREARAAVKIKSEHVARVTDVGQLENGAPYMVMEYLEGSDLSAWLEERGRLPIEQATDFILQACDAIATAHALGIVHRDLKPANLFCIRRGDGALAIKVLDFGISKVTSANAPVPDMTRTTTVMGSPYYMSPEQMRASKDVDARSDIWALGVILYELVTGRAPFVAETVTDLAIKIATEPAAPARTLRAEIPVGLELALAKCLQKDRAQRYQSVSELAIALREFGSRHAPALVERILGTAEHARLGPNSSGQVAPMSSARAATLASFGKTGPDVNVGAKTRTRVIAAAVVLVVLGGTLAFARRGGGPGPSTSASAASGSLAAESPATSARAVPIAVASAAEPAALSAPVIVDASVAVPPSPSVAVPVSHAAPPGPHPGAPSPRSPPAPIKTAPSAVPASKPNCNPAYTIDSAGHRQYKPECL